MTYMLDTNMCIYVINERDPALRERFVEHAGSLFVSSISYAELVYGVVHSRRVKHNACELAAFVEDLDILPFGQEGAGHYGDIRHALTKKGGLIGANDLLIAAHARSIDATLVTNNEREFRRVPKLHVENWLRQTK
ncbi:MAG: PIN domain-containing protein [Woeseia sp.]